VPTLTGHLLLEAVREGDGRTALARQSFRAPFHLSKPYWHGHVLQVQVVNPTAGMLEGDRLELEVRVRAGAALWVTTPSHARAFRAAGAGGVECRQTLTVAAGGWLDWWPEPLVPHAGCDYCQETVVELEAGAALFFCDAIGPGRVARGETWAWRRLKLGLTVNQGGRPVLRERFDLAAETARDLAALAGQRQAWLATCAIVGVGDNAALWSEVRALHGPETWVGASRLAGVDAWSLRIAAADGQRLRDTVSAVRRILAQRLPGLSAAVRRA
jgi:urease accessory protein